MQTNLLSLVSGIHRLIPDDEAATGPPSRKGNHNGQDCCYRLCAPHPPLLPPDVCYRSRFDGLGPYFTAQRRPPPLRPLRLVVKYFVAQRRGSLSFLPDLWPRIFPGPFFAVVCLAHPLRQIRR